MASINARKNGVSQQFNLRQGPEHEIHRGAIVKHCNVSDMQGDAIFPTDKNAAAATCHEHLAIFDG